MSGYARASRLQKRRELVEFLKPYRKNALAAHPWKNWAEDSDDGERRHRMPGGQSRWSQGKDFRGNRSGRSSSLKSRTTTCRAIDSDTLRSSAAGETTRNRAIAHIAQLEVVPPQELAEIFAGRISR